jgi:hypothetical protein
VICLDEMGPESAKSFPGQRLVHGDPNGERRGRARQEIDYGRRGRGYVFGAFVPATGAALTVSYPRRTIANVVAFLQHVEDWLAPSIDRVYAVLDNLAAHRALDVLLWALAHPRWEFVFQPRYAAYLNLIEPWWKVLRSLPSRDAALRRGSSSARQSIEPPSTGMSTAIPSSGGGASTVALPVPAASHASR